MVHMNGYNKQSNPPYISEAAAEVIIRPEHLRKAYILQTHTVVLTAFLNSCTTCARCRIRESRVVVAIISQN